MIALVALQYSLANEVTYRRYIYLSTDEVNNTLELIIHANVNLKYIRSVAGPCWLVTRH
jgi:hypothetical protein